MPEPAQIRAYVEGPAGIVQFARPEARNALTDTMLAETREAMASWELDGRVSAVILTGDEQAFCAGGDVKKTASAKMPPFEKYRYRMTASVWHEFIRYIGNYAKPVIAAVEGYSLGGGLEIVLRCDFAVGSDAAIFGMTEAKLGLFPILGGAWSLSRAVGSRKARELAYTARRIDAKEALEIGILNHVAEKGEALNRAMDIVGEISENAPLAVMALKQAINRSHSQSFEEALVAGGDLSAMLAFSEDRKEGIRAFLEKRKPEFKGN
ncbi:MAG: enoyl-CoA hydratase/isomerase family protein [Albidovulum sp.]|nr:enoyl-CoA hydratase/isomerase family protein [Albidovulum sp.]